MRAAEPPPPGRDRPRRARRPGRDESDQVGFDARGYVSKTLAALVPPSIATRAVSVSVATDRETYAVGDPVYVSVTFRNRLPVPIAVPTPERRLWGWSVDGELEASDERRYTRPEPAEFVFQAGETKRATALWRGRFERTGDRHEWVLPDPGEYGIAAFVATADRRPRDATTVILR